MSALYLTQPISHSSFSSKPLLKPSSITKLKRFHHLLKPHKKKKIKRGICRTEFSPDAPLAAAIGACMLSSLLLPVADTGDEDGGDSAIDEGDTRFVAMGIISFIPYFNWLSWVFAWLDTGKRRYAVYSIVYLAPYSMIDFGSVIVIVLNSPVFVQGSKSVPRNDYNRPFKINGVPLRRVNQSYVVATSTKVDISGVNVEKFDDKYFAKEAEKKKKKSEGEFFEDEKQDKKTLPDGKK